jgi:hypothetical protein
MEYGEAISARAYARAFEIAGATIANGVGNARKAASEAIAKAYCVCVVDGKDTTQGHVPAIHATLIDELEASLRNLIMGKESR